MPAKVGRPVITRVRHRVKGVLVHPADDDTGAALSVVNRKSIDEFLHLLTHRRLGERVLLNALLREGLEHFYDQFAHFLELGNAEAATRPRGGARRTPEVTAGFCGSKGTPFLL